MTGKNKNVASSRVMDKRTICEVHREIYDLLEVHFEASEIFPLLVEKLEEAYIMAKKMNSKLRQYKFNYDEEWWEETSKEIQQEKLSQRGKR